MRSQRPVRNVLPARQQKAMKGLSDRSWSRQQRVNGQPPQYHPLFPLTLIGQLPVGLRGNLGLVVRASSLQHTLEMA